MRELKEKLHLTHALFYNGVSLLFCSFEGKNVIFGEIPSEYPLNRGCFLCVYERKEVVLLVCLMTSPVLCGEHGIGVCYVTFIN